MNVDRFIEVALPLSATVFAWFAMAAIAFVIVKRVFLGGMC